VIVCENECVALHRELEDSTIRDDFNVIVFENECVALHRELDERGRLATSIRWR